MKVTLSIDGKEKIFVAPFISGRMLRKTIEIQKNNNMNDLDVDTLDLLINYVVDLFGKQFTIDEFYDGIPSNQLISTVMDCLNEVIGKTVKATEPLQDPNDK